MLDTENKIPKKIIDKIVYHIVRIKFSDVPSIQDDLIQEAYLKVYTVLKDVRGTDKENYSYLYRSAYYGVVDAYHKITSPYMAVSELTSKYVDEDSDDNYFICNLLKDKSHNIEQDIDDKDALKDISISEEIILKRWLVDDFTQEEILIYYEDLLGVRSWRTLEEILNKYNLSKNR